MGEGGEDADGGTIRALLSEVSRLEASGFFASADTLPAQGGALRLFGPSGDTLLDLSLGGGSGDRWARVAGDSIIYRMPSWRVDRILPEAGTL